jgi:tetratricopeptide (TPR) repeat protein
MEENYPDLTVREIQDWVGPASFSRGENYFYKEAIIEPRRQGMTLKASCLGSYAPSYRVQATLVQDGIAEAKCSCPVGEGGHCKHVAALLLAWVYDPETFEESVEVETSLELRSKPELIALIRQMLQRYPDLEYLLKLPSPIKSMGQAAIDPGVIRQQVSRAFGGSGYEWSGRDLFEAARDFDELLNLAGQYLVQADFTNAAMIYRVVAEEILHYENIVTGDESGGLGELVDTCVEGLGDCLESIQDTNKRQEILKAILNVYLWDIRIGGVGIGDSAPEILLENATTQEKELLAGLIRSALPGIQKWGQETLGGLLLDLQAEELDDEAFLEICRQTGRLIDLVNRLLQLSRLDESVRETEKAKDYQLPALADLFVQHGHGSRAERIMHARFETSQDDRLIDWLKGYAIQQGDYPKALEWAKQLFLSRHSKTEYLEMKNLAIPINQWPSLRTEMIDWLTDHQHFSVLTEIYLEEKEIDLALEALEKTKVLTRYRWEYPHSLEIIVAKAADETRPEHAIQLYMDRIKRLIERRGRDNYAEAANYLKVVQGIYKRLEQQEHWQSLIASLRQENRNLPAFQDELKKAKL